MAFTGQAAAASCTASTQQSPSPTTVERSPSISKTCGQIPAHNPHPIHSSVTFTFIFLLLLPLAVLLTLYTCLNKINTFFQNGTKKCGYNTKNDNFFENCNRLRCKLHASTFFENSPSKSDFAHFASFQLLIFVQSKVKPFYANRRKNPIHALLPPFFGKDFRNIGCLLSDIAFDAPATVIFASSEGNSATRGSGCTPNVVAKFCAKSTLCNKRTPCSGMRFC